MVFQNDREKLIAINKYDIKHIEKSSIQGNWIDTIKKKKDSLECTFWDNEKMRCSIYENRPFDCMIYPFDILPVEGKYYWIVYSCNPHGNWEWSENHLKVLENSREFSDIMKNLQSYSHVHSFQKDKIDSTSYSIIREIKPK